MSNLTCPYCSGPVKTIPMSLVRKIHWWCEDKQCKGHDFNIEDKEEWEKRIRAGDEVGES